MGVSVTPGSSKVSWQKREEEEEPEGSGDDGSEDGPVGGGGDDCRGELRLDGGQSEVG